MFNLNVTIQNQVVKTIYVEEYLNAIAKNERLERWKLQILKPFSFMLLLFKNMLEILKNPPPRLHSIALQTNIFFYSRYL